MHSEIGCRCSGHMECIYRRKPTTFAQANEIIGRYIYFYNHERVQYKTGVALLTLRHSV